jgi:glycosyltransferase involved in cell wall biosynthesis
MRIGLNLLPVVPGIGGSWHYIASLLGALTTHDHENQYVAFVTKASASLISERPNFTCVELPLHATLRPLRIAYENSFFPLVSHRYRLDCIHHFFGTLPLFGGEASVVTVFDVMAFARPTDFSMAKGAYLRMMRRRAAKNASVLAPMSQSTARSLREWLDVPDARMKVVLPSLSSEFYRRSAADVDAFRALHGIAEDFWLCVAGPYPHKNLERMIEAFAQLREQQSVGWSLVIRGHLAGQLEQRIAGSALQRHVRFLPWLSDGDMPLLYSAASALIFPSLYEGGGLPVIEAMGCGCPIVASKLPTTHEFAGEAALTFDPVSVPDMVRVMSECEQSCDTRARMSASAKTRASRFDSLASASSCIEAYRAAVASTSAMN